MSAGFIDSYEDHSVIFKLNSLTHPIV